MSDSDDDRLIALEIRLAHFERLAEDLSEVVACQDRRLDLLDQQIHRMRERMADMAAGFERSPQDDRPPPHY